jgi:hypothetical protein
MTRRPASKSDVREELWRSFASLLRSYAAAAGLNGISHGVLLLGEDSMHVVSGRNTLKISYHPTLGRGLWSLHQEADSGTDRHEFAVMACELERGDFDVNPDGTIQLNGAAVEIDHAAIQLIASLTAAAARNQLEVPA